MQISIQRYLPTVLNILFVDSPTCSDINSNSQSPNLKFQHDLPIQMNKILRNIKKTLKPIQVSGNIENTDFVSFQSSLFSSNIVKEQFQCIFTNKLKILIYKIIIIIIRTRNPYFQASIPKTLIEIDTKSLNQRSTDNENIFLAHRKLIVVPFSQ